MNQPDYAAGVFVDYLPSFEPTRAAHRLKFQLFLPWMKFSYTYDF
ncbi:hypothetical protein [Moorena sp. SIO4A1]|nr:hypothetical protein [Moorena sp. SIO4A1]